MRFMVWYLGLGLHIAALVKIPSADRGDAFVVGTSLVLWLSFGAVLVVAAAVRRIKQAGVSRLTPREVANLTKKVGE